MDHVSPCTELTELGGRVKAVEDTAERHEQMLAALLNRLPTWATFVIAALTAYAGWASK